jgi:hypothetical protein
MRGLLTQADYITDKDRYTDVGVYRSAAGWYIGTMYNHPDGWKEPGSRESEEYYATEREARQALVDQTFTQRYHP